MTTRWLYCVRYRRVTWKKEQRRYFVQRAAAVDLLLRLRGRRPAYEHLAPLEYAVMLRAPIGEMEQIEP